MTRKATYLARFGVFVAVVALTSVDAAFAADITSDYTKIDLTKCALTSPPSDEGTHGGSWHCEGYQGQTVYVAEGDLRMFVSFGPNAKNEPAASQTLPNFNTINETLEWRLKGDYPFATILRWFPSLEDGSTGSVLIVTQIQSGGGTCQIARIDARANENANVLARQAADQMAGQFDCNAQPKIIGNPGLLAY